MSDLISRQAAIDALMEILDRPNHAEFLYTDEICKALSALPSADRPTGEWEQVPYKRQGHEEVITDGHSWRCSNCGDARKRNQPDMRFCPNCGAKMKGADDETN